jgi:hypothetical protein
LASFPCQTADFRPTIIPRQPAGKCWKTCVVKTNFTVSQKQPSLGVDRNSSAVLRCPIEQQLTLIQEILFQCQLPACNIDFGLSIPVKDSGLGSDRVESRWFIKNQVSKALKSLPVSGLFYFTNSVTRPFQKKFA